MMRLVDQATTTSERYGTSLLIAWWAIFSSIEESAVFLSQRSPRLERRSLTGSCTVWHKNSCVSSTLGPVSLYLIPATIPLEVGAPLLSSLLLMHCSYPLVQQKTLLRIRTVMTCMYCTVHSARCIMVCLFSFDSRVSFLTGLHAVLTCVAGNHVPGKFQIVSSLPLQYAADSLST